MARITRIRLTLFAIGLAVVTTASAQEGPNTALAAGGASGMRPAPVLGSGVGPVQPVQHNLPASPVSANGEPVELAGMLAAHNQVRARLGLAALTWSASLASEAKTVAADGAHASCTFSTAQRDLRSPVTSIYWAAPIRQSDGLKTTQTLAPNFIVSEWQQGASSYDAAKAACAKPGGACDDFARIAAPKTRLVGCARMVCPTQAQIWVCRYGDQPRP